MGPFFLSITQSQNLGRMSSLDIDRTLISPFYYFRELYLHLFLSLRVTQNVNPATERDLPRE